MKILSFLREFITALLMFFVEELIFGLAGGKDLLINAYPFLKPWLMGAGIALLWPTFLLLKISIREWNSPKKAILLKDLNSIYSYANYTLELKAGSMVAMAVIHERKYQYLVMVKYENWFGNSENHEENAKRALIYMDLINTHGYWKGLSIIKKELLPATTTN